MYSAWLLFWISCKFPEELEQSMFTWVNQVFMSWPFLVKNLILPACLSNSSKLNLAFLKLLEVVIGLPALVIRTQSPVRFICYSPRSQSLFWSVLLKHWEIHSPLSDRHFRFWSFFFWFVSWEDKWAERNYLSIKQKGSYFKDLFLFIYVYEFFTCTYISVLYTCLVPMEAGRGHWHYRWL